MDSKGFRNVEVLHNPLFLKTADTVAGKDNVILAVGRIDAWNYKGFDLLINAWEQDFHEISRLETENRRQWF